MIIPLIQALYDPHTRIPRDLPFYEQAIKEIERGALSSQIYYLLKQCDRWAQVPLFFQERLTEQYHTTLCLNLFIKHQTDQLLRELESLGIPVIPLKGVYFAEKYFGHLGARATTDIDVLLHKGDLKQAIACVKLLGYTIEQEGVSSHFHASFSKQLPHSEIPLTVELHWDLLIEKTSNLTISEFWKQATPMASFQFVKELSEYHTFYMICLHGWSHYMDSPKYFIDIIQMLHRHSDHIHYSHLFQDAAVHQTLRRMIRTLVHVYAHFPHLSDIKELPIQHKNKLYGKYQTTKPRNFELFASKIYHKFFNFDSLTHTWAALIHFTNRLGNLPLSHKIKKM
ncbi:nucleotidyltransferase family protein [Paenibacillus alba]|uniref:nucleotidyltransferase family protein n=1 Tax=Paenibacillus alba TaxID=1197127 RepID=UPI0015656A7E|nr:nucleotidyltransferase family protein [Paenibacillus alba]NQX66750.1 nucleotidyltransferase family protein [Paenibacillus alba]